MPPSIGRRLARSAATLLLGGLLAALALGAAGAAPRRIVSLNACADQYLIALADKDQIVALTQFARDPNLSFYADRARGYPVSDGQAEAVLAMKPDLVIASPYHRGNELSLLKGRAPMLEL